MNEPLMPLMQGGVPLGAAGTPKRSATAAAATPGGDAKRIKFEEDGKKSGVKASGGGRSRAGPSPSCRYDSSLGLLTRKFVELVQQVSDGNMDLNAAAQQLQVQKRRIYDITNVLEGIGLIKKESKNNISWQGSGLSIPEAAQEELKELRGTIDNLRMEEIALDQYLTRIQELVQQTSKEHESRIYLRHEDIRSLECFADQTVIAIKAPPGTTLEVPDPYESVDGGQRRYQIYLCSAGGGIDVYLVSTLPQDIQMTHEALENGNGSAAPATGVSASQERPSAGSSASTGAGAATGGAASTSANAAAPPAAVALPSLEASSKDPDVRRPGLDEALAANSAASAAAPESRARPPSAAEAAMEASGETRTQGPATGPALRSPVPSGIPDPFGNSPGFLSGAVFPDAPNFSPMGDDLALAQFLSSPGGPGVGGHDNPRHSAEHAGIVKISPLKGDIDFSYQLDEHEGITDFFTDAF